MPGGQAQVGPEHDIIEIRNSLDVVFETELDDAIVYRAGHPPPMPVLRIGRNAHLLAHPLLIRARVLRQPRQGARELLVFRRGHPVGEDNRIADRIRRPIGEGRGRARGVMVHQQPGFEAIPKGKVATYGLKPFRQSHFFP